MNYEEISFQLILHSGNARSLAHEALSDVKEDKVEIAKEKLKEAKEELLQSQKLHAQMLREMANDVEIKINLLLIHAEDHVASSDCVLMMANEVVGIYERFGKTHG
ncbi:PTS lactose/cellobiose transporter subunit IIA [Amedibacillus sp. YH-ame10]